MPTDLLRLILAACEATVLPSLAVTCKLIEETTSHRRSLLAMLIADPFNVGDIHRTTYLSLGRKIKDTHLTTFAGACASGALPALKRLELYQNTIGDAGLSALADVVSKGALHKLIRLELQHNYIGDDGITAFTDAVSKGALRALKELYLYGNSIGDVGMKAFADAVRSGALDKLET